MADIERGQNLEERDINRYQAFLDSLSRYSNMQRELGIPDSYIAIMRGSTEELIAEGIVETEYSGENLSDEDKAEIRSRHMPEVDAVIESDMPLVPMVNLTTHYSGGYILRAWLGKFNPATAMFQEESIIDIGHQFLECDELNSGVCPQQWGNTSMTPTQIRFLINQSLDLRSKYKTNFDAFTAETE